MTLTQHLSSPAALTELLGTLFEPSPELKDNLVPKVLERIKTSPPRDYNELVDVCAEVGNAWDWDTKSSFIHCHPMIGEVSGLSAHSAKEQGQGTPKVVLDRLAHLNSLYCKVYPGLRYITFVAGRSRATIVNEMERFIGIPETPNPLPSDYAYVNEPALDSETATKLVRQRGSDEWKAECDRAIKDVWKIGKARLQNMGLQ